MRVIHRMTLVVGTVAVALGVTTWASAVGGGRCHEGATLAEGTTVVMERSCFIGTVTYAPAGEPITFVNRDKVPHTVTGVGWDGGEIEGFGEASVRFPEEGVYVYTCVYHPGMSGALVIGDAAGPGAAEGEPTTVPRTEEPEPTPETGPTGSLVPTPALGVIAGLLAGGLGFGLGRRRR